MQNLNMALTGISKCFLKWVLANERPVCYNCIFQGRGVCSNQNVAFGNLAGSADVENQNAGG